MHLERAEIFGLDDFFQYLSSTIQHAAMLSSSRNRLHMRKVCKASSNLRIEQEAFRYSFGRRGYPKLEMSRFLLMHVCCSYSVVCSASSLPTWSHPHSQLSVRSLFSGNLFLGLGLTGSPRITAWRIRPHKSTNPYHGLHSKRLPSC